MATEGYKLVVEATGEEVAVGTELTDFRGEKWLLKGWYIRTLHHWTQGNTSGRVQVRRAEEEPSQGWGTAEFYPSVFNLAILPKEPVS